MDNLKLLDKLFSSPPPGYLYYDFSKKKSHSYIGIYLHLSLNLLIFKTQQVWGVPFAPLA